MQGRNADSLCHYFGEDPNRCPFEQGNIFFHLKQFLDRNLCSCNALIFLENCFILSFVEIPLLLYFAVTQILAVFVKMFNKSRGENEKQADVEKKKLEKEAMKEKAAANSASLRR